MSGIVGSYFRRHQRYRIKDHAGTTVTIDTVDDPAQSVSAQLVDLSLGGAKFETHIAIGIKQPVSVRIDSTSLKQSIHVVGEVSWVKPVRSGTWEIGCAFWLPISPEVLECFAQEGVLERRRRPRILVSLSALAKWELESEEIPISVVDYSVEGGFRLLAPDCVQPGRGVELQFHNAGRDIIVRGRSIWECETDEGHYIGCEFLTFQDSVRFSRILEDLADRGKSCRLWLRTLRRTHAITVLTLLAQRRHVRRLAIVSTVACLAVLLGAFLKPGTSPSRSTLSNPSAAPPLSIRSMADPLDEEPPQHAGGVKFGTEVPTETQFVFTPIEVDPEPAVAGTILDITPQPTPPSLPLLPAPTVTPGRATSSPPKRTHTITPKPADDPHSEKAPPTIDQGAASPAPAAHDRQHAFEQFQAGCKYYRRGEFERAVSSLQSASDADPDEPLYLYILALAQFQLQSIKQAEQSVAQAARLERTTPLKDWGRTMERHQGPPRVWLEQARLRALQGRPESALPRQ